MKKILTLIALLGTMITAFAQSNGEIKGKITDETGDGLTGATVQILDGAGRTTGRGAAGDLDGNYTLSGLTAGTYDLQFSYIGLPSKIVKSVLVRSDNATKVDVKLVKTATSIKEVEVVTYKQPLISSTDTKIEVSITKDQIKERGASTVNDIAATSAGVTQSDAGAAVVINGAREDETQYIINGHRVIGKPVLPTTGIKEISVLAGGISAKYGDVTGGIVNITLNDAQQNWGGSAEVRTTKGLDPFGTTRAGANVYGPLIKVRDRAFKGDTTGNKRTLLGFSASFQYQYDFDRAPSSIGLWQVKQSVLDNIRTGPIVPNPAGGFYNKANYLTFADMYKTSSKPNDAESNYVGSGEIGLYPVKGISVTIGGTYNYDTYNRYIREYSLLNAEHNPQYKTTNYILYGRLSQRFDEMKKPKKEGDDKAAEKRTGLKVQNGSYTLQVDYEKYKTGYADQFHGANLFEYGYIGQFETQSVNSFSYVKNKPIGNIKNLTGWVLNQTTTDTAVVFTPSKSNPLGAEFTKEYFQLLGAQQNAEGGYFISGGSKVGLAQNIDQIAQFGGLINGQRSTPIYDLWYNVGRQYNGYGVDANDESYRGKLEGAFDIVKLGSEKNNTHKIEVGFEYEQRIQRSYTINPLNLWDIARNLVNNQLVLDTANPIFRINGVDYTNTNPNRPAFFATDTVLYNRRADLTKNADGTYKLQTYFDRNLRTALGKDPNGADKIDLFNIKESDLSKMSLKLFSASELIGYTTSTGGTIIGYKGYDYQGNVQTGNPSVRDFFYQKNADGQYTRPQAAFMPTYAAGYIQDKFFYKDLGFVVGLRVDRYDANQAVLKDPYSLYEVRKAGDVTTLNGGDGTKIPVSHPAGIGTNFAVYVDQNGNGQHITGYRDGDNWYDAYGRPATGKSVANASGGAVLPLTTIPGAKDLTAADTRQYIKNTNFDPNLSFTQYQAQYLFMPRLQFAFNITDKAQFFAHYDVLSQRPQARNDLNLAEYYYFTEYTGVKNNPNLKPIKKVDYEFGFKQQVASFAAITLSAFYQETRNLIQLRKIQYAFPSDYTTYDNIDFRSAKGVRLLFDIRRIKNFQFNANYTLQFVEGTGSDDQSQQYLVSSNQPNFRSVYYISTDYRHQIKFNLDYRFGHGKAYTGPTVGPNAYKILEDFGVNFALQLRSGGPVRQSTTVSDDASISGTTGRQRTYSLDARLPWYTRIDMRVNKDFTFNVGKKSNSKEPGHEIGLSIYVYIQNLLNTQNILTVFPYTLNSNDDGYLKSAVGGVNVAAQVNPQSYKDLYRAKMNNPDNYSLPRRIYLGASINF